MFFKKWKNKNVEEKADSCMFWFRLFIVLSVIQACLQIMVYGISI